MCSEHIHSCLYCHREYPCDLPNQMCPTLHYDEDGNMCDNCRLKLEKEIEKMNAIPASIDEVLGDD